MNWKENAIKVLEESLYPVAMEKNEIDWKSGLSPKNDRLAKHISAFANRDGGGMFVFGVNDDASLFSIDKKDADKIVKTLGNIADHNLCVPIKIEHWMTDYHGHSLLFVYVPEQSNRPVHLRCSDIYDSYCRSAGRTVKMSRSQVKNLIALSLGITFEQTIAKRDVCTEEILRLLNYRKFYELMEKNVPSNSDSIIGFLSEYQLCVKNDNSYDITNLGAILFANKLSDFPHLEERHIIVRKYVGANNRELENSFVGEGGYAVELDSLVESIFRLLPKKEIIKDVLREERLPYPKVTVRELLANAMIHQNFGITGMNTTVEIFSNRLSITNPGESLNELSRLIDLPPKSRNEKLAQTFFLMKLCERRGSGIDRAVEGVEKMGLPPIKLDGGEDFTRVTIYTQKKYTEMTKAEKILACYQHACLLNEDGIAMSNQSLRDRLGISKNNSAVASRIISDTINAGLIRAYDPDNESKKFILYIPFYA